MASELVTMINGLLLVATADNAIDEHLHRCLAEGGRTVLLAESREEYVARAMSAERVASESAAAITATIMQARGLAGPVLLAVDEEIGGIQRLAHMIPPLPALEDILAATNAELDAAFTAHAQQAKALGVNTFLAPIVDTLSGANPWLQGRTVSADVSVVARISERYVRALEAAAVMAVVKHFPGHPCVPLDPAVDEASTVVADAELLQWGYPAFAASIAAGAGGMMLGPAPVPAIDASAPATCSRPVVELLRGRFGFSGLVVSDGLGAAATAAGRPLVEVAVQSLNAGAELLLVGSGDYLPAFSEGIAAAVRAGQLPEQRLRQAADKVQRCVAHYAAP